MTIELQRKSIQKAVVSWRLVQKLPDYTTLVGEILFRQIFQLAPGAISLYGFGYGVDEKHVPESLFSSPTFLSHARGVVRMLETALTLMLQNQLEDLSEALAGLGARHVRYGVLPAHYIVVEAALQRTLEIGLKEKFTPTLRRHWSAVFKFVAKAMMTGAQSTIEIKQSSTSLIIIRTVLKTTFKTIEKIYDDCTQ